MIHFVIMLTGSHFQNAVCTDRNPKGSDAVECKPQPRYQAYKCNKNSKHSKIVLTRGKISKLIIQDMNVSSHRSTWGNRSPAEERQGLRGQRNARKKAAGGTLCQRKGPWDSMNLPMTDEINSITMDLQTGQRSRSNRRNHRFQRLRGWRWGKANVTCGNCWESVIRSLHHWIVIQDQSNIEA